MKQGYDVFGPAYGVMMRNDLHALESIDHKFMREMILLDGGSREFLYRAAPAKINMEGHELYRFAMRFRENRERRTIGKALRFTAEIAADYQTAFEDMKFGGTEKEILDRGTDWCADLARVGAVLLQCNGIPARIIHLANLNKAYHGHVVTEAYYEGKYGVCDFLYGYCFYDGQPLDAYDLMCHKQYLEGCPEDYASLYSAAAISEYDPMGDNDYTVSLPNQYTTNIINTDHGGKWFMGEDGPESKC